MPPVRYHGLDFLRAFAMLLGILLHGALSFTEPITQFWPVHDTQTSFIPTIFIVLAHDFRMQLFFVLAGFFTALLHDRYGLMGMLRHRFQRVGIPFLLCMVTIVPILEIIWLLGDRSALLVLGIPLPDRSLTSVQVVGQLFRTGEFLERLLPLHLWFLYFLLWFYAAMIPLAPLGRRLALTGLGRKFGDSLHNLLGNRWSCLILAALTLPSLLLMKLPFVDTNNGWFPAPHLLGYYFLFFLFGWLLYQHHDRLGGYARGWRSQLITAQALVALPMLLGVAASLEIAQGRANPLPITPEAVRLSAILFSAVYTWLMIPGLIGAFLHYFSGHRKWVRYVADASYWCYIASLIPLILLQMLVADWSIPWVLKFLLVNVVALGLLLASYQFFVRYTLIGRILNGPRA